VDLDEAIILDNTSKSMTNEIDIAIHISSYFVKDYFELNFYRYLNYMNQG